MRVEFCEGSTDLELQIIDMDPTSKQIMFLKKCEKLHMLLVLVRALVFVLVFVLVLLLVLVLVQ